MRKSPYRDTLTGPAEAGARREPDPDTSSTGHDGQLSHGASLRSQRHTANLTVVPHEDDRATELLVGCDAEVAVAIPGEALARALEQEVVTGRWMGQLSSPGL